MTFWRAISGIFDTPHVFAQTLSVRWLNRVYKPWIRKMVWLTKIGVRSVLDDIGQMIHFTEVRLYCISCSDLRCCIVNIEEYRRGLEVVILGSSEWDIYCAWEYEVTLLSCLSQLTSRVDSYSCYKWLYVICGELHFVKDTDLCVQQSWFFTISFPKALWDFCAI